MAQVSVCEVDPDLLSRLKTFKRRKEKNIAALVLKVDAKTQTVILEEEHEDITVEELRNELPENQPRYVLLSYVHKRDDGRVSYPQLCIFCSPSGCKPEQQMMYAGSKNEVIRKAEATRCYDIRGLDELTEEFVLEKLGR